MHLHHYLIRINDCSISHISNKEMKDIINMFKSYEESSLFLKDVSETIASEAKEQKDRFLCMLLY